MLDFLTRDDGTLLEEPLILDTSALPGVVVGSVWNDAVSVVFTGKR